MNVFGLIIGCPKAVTHCKHFHKDRTREMPAEFVRGCNKMKRPWTIRERQDKCCKCDWASPWRRAHLTASGLWR